MTALHVLQKEVYCLLTTCYLDSDAAEAASISPRSLAKQLNIGNTAALERRIKRELEENGEDRDDTVRPLAVIQDAIILGFTTF